MTGGTGVTGVALVRYLLSIGIEVVAIVRPGSFREKYLPDDSGLTLVYAKLQELRNAILQIKEKTPIDVFFHLAWEGSTIANKQDSRDDMMLQSRNIVYTIDAVEVCHAIGCPVFLMTGSQAEYGTCNELINESITSFPVNGYGNAKLCAENMTRIMCAKYGIKHICARLFSIYGPYDGTNSLINTSILELLNGKRPKYTKGTQMWNYLYSFDAAKALYLLAERGKDGEIYNVAGMENKPLKYFIEVVHKVVNKDIPVVLGEKDIPIKDLRGMMADVSKLIKTVGDFEEYTFEDGIKRIRDWCIETNEIYVGGVENTDFIRNV